MKRCSVWRCKQCGLVIYNAESAKIYDNTFDELFSSNTVCNNLTGFDLQPLNIRIVVTLKQLDYVILLDGGSKNDLLHHRTLLLHGH